MIGEADVHRDATLVGRIARTKHGSIFEYDDAFLRARPSGERGIAFRLPYAKKRFETVGVNLHTFFAGLLPEGLRLQTLVRRTKTSADDLLTLLIAAGADCIGDVAVTKAGAAPIDTSPAVEVEKLGRASFADVLKKSLGSTREPTIPGVQEKVSALMVSLPLRPSRAGSFILKLNPPGVPLLVENEHFFMAMARACGLRTADTELVRDRDGASGLLVRRFDRSPEGKLHQEDACQLLDRYPADKYRLSTREAMEALEVCSAPTIERTRLLRLVAFSYLVGNGDLHGKNISVRVASKLTELTPAYDVLSTLPYGDAHLALKVDARDAKLRRKTFVQFGERFDIPAKATEAILDELLDRSEPFLPRLDEIGFDKKRTARLRQTLGRRRDELR